MTPRSSSTVSGPSDTASTVTWSARLRIPSIPDTGEVSTVVEIRVDRDGYLLVVSKSRGEPGHHRGAVLYRDGTLIGTAGPWELFPPIGAATERGFTLVGGGEEQYYGRRAPDEFRLAVSDDTAPRRVEHFLAWLLPARDETRYSLRRCEGMSPARIRPRLTGVEFDRELAALTQDAYMELGQEWLLSVINDNGLASLIRTVDPSSDTWMSDMRPRHAVRSRRDFTGRRSGIPSALPGTARWSANRCAATRARCSVPLPRTSGSSCLRPRIPRSLGST